MSTGALLAIDLVAVLLLAFGLYFPRYQRRDMVVALLGINIGVMAVATALANAEVSAGVGLSRGLLLVGGPGVPVPVA